MGQSFSLSLTLEGCNEDQMEEKRMVEAVWSCMEKWWGKSTQLPPYAELQPPKSIDLDGFRRL